MTTYYMTSHRISEIGYWEKCNATTLIGAKREATRKYGAGNTDTVLIIAEGDNITEPRRNVASKSSYWLDWVNHD